MMNEVSIELSIQEVNELSPPISTDHTNTENAHTTHSASATSGGPSANSSSNSSSSSNSNNNNNNNNNNNKCSSALFGGESTSPNSGDGEIETIDDLSQLFRDIDPPTLEDSLKTLGVRKHKEMCSRCMTSADDIVCTTGALTPQDIAVITSYMQPEQGPRGIVDDVLTTSRSKSALKKVRGYLYLLLKALRRLPRYSPGTHRLYCAARVSKRRFRQQLHSSSAVFPLVLWAPTLAYERREALPAAPPPNPASSGDTAFFVLSGPHAWGYNVAFVCEKKDSGAIVVVEPGRMLSVTRELDNEHFFYAEINNDNTIAMDHHVSTVAVSTPVAVAASTSASLTVSASPSPPPVVVVAVPSTSSTVSTVNTINTSSSLATAQPPVASKKDDKKRNKAQDSQIDPPEAFTAESVTWNSAVFTWSVPQQAQTPAVVVVATGTPTGTPWYQVVVRPKGGSSAQESIHCSKGPRCVARGLSPDTLYTARVRAGGLSKAWGKWSATTEFQTPPKPAAMECAWRECPDTVAKKRRYAVSGPGCEVATKVNGGDCFCAAVKDGSLVDGHTYRVRIIKTQNGSGSGIYVGVAPADVDQNSDAWDGWLFSCYFGLLWSGPPHNYRGKEYGPPPRREWGTYVKAGDDVSILMDAKTASLEFAVGGTSLGVAYEGIPLDKPLTIIALMLCMDDSVQLLN